MDKNNISLIIGGWTLKRLNILNIVQFIIIALLVVSNYCSIFYHTEYVNYWINKWNEFKEFILRVFNFFKNHFIWIFNQKYDFSLNNRELALVILFVIFIMWVLSQTEIRSSLTGLIKALFNKYFNRVYVEILIYTLFVIHMLYRFGLWKFIYMKDTIIWIVLSATYLSFKVADNTNPKLLSEIMKDTFSIVVLFEFLLNIYTFSLIIELFVISLLFFIGIMIAFTEVFPEKDKGGKVKRLFNILQMYIGFNIIVFLVREIIVNPNKLFQFEQLRAFILPIVLTISFIPYLIYLITWTTYDLIEFELKQNKELTFFQRQYFRIRIRLHCKLNRETIKQYKVDKNHLIRNMKTWKDIKSCF